jgi:hypothetical protein
MKLVFFSADATEVDQASREFVSAGIPCEVRHLNGETNEEADPGCTELWVKNDQDGHRAFMLCVQLRIGFARRHPKSSGIECWSDICTQPQPEPAEEFPTMAAG